MGFSWRRRAVKKQAQIEPRFIQQFTSASQDHYHYENGAKYN
ncbi:DUF7710 domain-containing protein [Sphingobacterium sp.]